MNALALLVAAALTAATLPAQVNPTGVPQAPVRADSSIVPAEDQARAVDAEVRASLFQLLSGQPIAALSRLQWLSTSPTVLTGGSDAGALRTREEMLFLLAEAYYSLGMDDSFRSAARQLGTSGTAGRFAPIINSQLMLDSYRRGDYNGAISLATTVGTVPAGRGLASLVAGLSAYQLGRYTDARTSFATVTGAPYSDYARYMDALTQLRVDTSSGPAALAAMQSIASSASGDFADQVRLAGAQLAYQIGQYPAAVQLANAIPATSGLAAQGLFTKAWSMYKADQLAPAGEAFNEFATRYPQLPEREESRLMYGQVLLQLGRTAEAASVFAGVADSATIAMNSLQARGSAMTDVARSLVTARAAGLLFLRDPATGKTVALKDGAGAEAQILAAVYSDSARAVPQATAPDVVTLSDVMQRIESITPPIDAMVPRRVLFAPVSATRTRGDFGQRAQEVYESDVAVALARHRVNELVEAQRLQLALLRRFQQTLANEMRTFDTVAVQIASASDSLQRLSTVLDASKARLTALFMQQIDFTRQYAQSNITAMDSLRRGLGSSLSPNDTELLALEAKAAQTYLQLAQTIESGLTGAISRHPVLAYGDSVRARGQRAATLLAEARAAGQETQRLVAEQIALLESGESDQVRMLRATLAAAEAQRGGAETRLVSVVETELRARAGEVVALLRRDGEAAEFGAASALFFQSLDAERTAGAVGSTDPSGAVRRPPIVPPSANPINPPKQE